MPDENGEKRRDRNIKFGNQSLNPALEIPVEGEHLWEWFWKVSNRRKTGPESISYAEIGEFQRMTGVAVRPGEVDILMAMDDSFLSEVRKEQQAAAARREEAAKRK